MAGDFIELERISKRFGATVALRGVHASFKLGRIHGLIGENGAGKSTLAKIVAGRMQPDSGQMRVNGRPVSYRRPQDATRDGISAVAQELAVLPHRSVLDNIICGAEPRRGGLVDRRAARQQFAQLAKVVGLDVDPGEMTGRLGLADQQKVEVMRALGRGARVLVFDEPTAKLPADDSERLLSLMHDLARRGTAVILISHFLEEVLATCEEVVLMRDGEVVRSGPTSKETVSSLVAGMLGRSLDAHFPEQTPRADAGEVALSASGVASPPLVHDVSLSVRHGELVGMFGLVGSGRSEFARSLVGADRRSHGEVTLNGVPLAARIRASIDAGIAMIPESRKTQGLMLNRSVLENIALPHLGRYSRLGCVRRGRQRHRVSEMAIAVGIDPSKLDQRVRELSGGNQQKVLFARWLLARPDVLVVDEPTRGVDVGAKRTIYDLLAEQVAGGTAVLLISSELDEIVGLAHRTVVLRNGRVAGEVKGAELTSDAILSLAFAEHPRHERGKR